MFSLVIKPFCGKEIIFGSNFGNTRASCGQSYKHFTLVNYDSRVVPDCKIPHITTLES